MIQRIRIYVNELFADAPQTKKAADLKEEVCSNLIDKFVDLTGKGMSEEEAYNAAVASIGDIDELKQLIRQDDEFEDPKARQRNALFVASAVGLYIISVIPLLLSDAAEYDPVFGLVAMFMICALATGLLIYNSMTRPKYHRLDDTMVEEFKEWKQQRDKNKGVFGAVSGALWMVVFALYFIISFSFGNWHISWIIFLIGAAVQEIIRAVIQLGKK
ncbi:MAG TPA: hypothetical protein DEB10_08955 [Ruminococcaceae bacterium]|jgi:hypothetical protein|nr:hypothetical protein [Oscillospiraceae bacterium]